MPLQFMPGDTRKTIGITGDEVLDILGLDNGLTPKMALTLRLTKPDGKIREIAVQCRIDTQLEIEWYAQGGVLQYVFANILRDPQARASA
jgi:aconitate hydratase